MVSSQVYASNPANHCKPYTGELSEHLFNSRQLTGNLKWSQTGDRLLIERLVAVRHCKSCLRWLLPRTSCLKFLALR